jgi:signal transduction histidine kinase
MSHELRTPLNAVLNFTKFVARGVLGPVNQEQVDTLNEVIDSGTHLLNLINDVLDMSKIESGSLNLFVEDGIDLNAVLKSTLTTAQTLLEGKPVHLQNEIDPDLPTIRGDKQRILQIFLNVVSNACRYTEEGFVKVAVRRQGDNEILFAVEDTGPGIAPEDHALVFEPFKQTASGIRRGGGTGLGMPITKNLVEIHGGRLWLESTPGKGSTFYVALPIQSEKLQPIAIVREKAP